MKLLCPSLALAAMLVLSACSDSQPPAGINAAAPSAEGSAEAQGEFQRLRELERGCCPDVEDHP